MTDQADLERGYRRLLAWYPREFRRENGQEILAVLMAAARDGQRRPGLAESADLIRGGVSMRLRPSMPRSARTVQAAVRLMYAGAAVSAVGLIIGLALIIVDIQVAARGQFLGHSLTADKPLVITVWIVFGLAGVSMWLWMARANAKADLGAHPVHGAVRPGDAAAARRFHAAGEPCRVRGDGAVLRRRRAVRRGLAGRRCCGMAAVAPGLHRVLQAAGFRAGPAPGAHGRTRPASIVQGTVAASGVSRIDPRAWAWPGGTRGSAMARPAAACRLRFVDSLP